METLLDFLHSCGFFYLASSDDKEARIRPLGFVMVYNNKLYFGVGDSKEVYAQLTKNPCCEIAATNKDMAWIRLRGKAVFDHSKEAKEAAYKVMPDLAKMYADPKAPVFVPFYLELTKATIDDLAGHHKDLLK